MHIKNFGGFINEADTPTQGFNWEINKPYKMKRSSDGQVYTITITNIQKKPDGSINYAVSNIDGQGTYEGQPLKRPGMSLQPTTDGKGLQGNTEMGTFTMA
jgi:hypothetical protein